MMNPRITFNVLIPCFFLLVGGCAAPFKMMPEYEKHQARLQRIALYPLHYSEDGKEERLFGMVFSDNFFRSVEAMPMIRPLKFIGPDSTVSLLEVKGISIAGHRGDIVEGTAFPIYKRLEPNDLQAISKDAHGLIFCDLLSYNEVGAGEELAQAIVTGVATTCLTGGLVTSAYSESNTVRMNITLFETTTGRSIWEYTPYFTASLTGEQRMRFTQNIVQGFLKYFPLSKGFQGK